MRTLFLSDLHIGSADFNHRRFEAFLDGLADSDPQCLYLVGDILDLRHIKRRRESRLAHYASLEKLADKAISRTTTYLWGNHDPEVQRLAALAPPGTGRFGSVTIARRRTHTLADGRRMLILHGDEMDAGLRVGITKTVINRITRYYYFVLAVDRHLFRLRSVFSPRARAWMPRLKQLSRRWTAYVHRYENAIALTAREAGADVVLCGHIHVPAMRRIGGVLYINCGDWVEHCTAVVEDACGTLRLIDWTGRTLACCRDAALTEAEEPSTCDA